MIETITFAYYWKDENWDAFESFGKTMYRGANICEWKLKGKVILVFSIQRKTYKNKRQS